MSEVALLITAFATLLTAVTGAFVAVWVQLRTIHQQTNSSLTKLNERLDKALAEVSRLRQEA